MGEARRRRLSGSYPHPDDAFEAVRRFWQGRHSGPVEDFRAPDGTVAITMDVQGQPPRTCMLDAAKIVTVMERVDAALKGMAYESIVRRIARDFPKAQQPHVKGEEWIGLAAVWTAFNHPKSGTEMRTAVSSSLRRDGKAHISWHVGKSGLAIALAERFIDMEGWTAMAPKNAVTVYFRTDEQEPMMH